MKKLFAALFISLTALILLPSAAFAEDVIPSAPENDIPMVIIRVDEPEDIYEEDGNKYGRISDMNTSWDHSVRCKGSVEFVIPEGYVSEYGGSAPAGEIDLEYIRGRGNSTWKAMKKPYKIKFAKADEARQGYIGGKQDLFNMGENREWALMANSRDCTLIKNRITSWLGEELGFEYSPRMVPVDVYMVGTETPAQYLGSYCLSELVQVDESRLDIETPKKSEAEEPAITGGYLLSLYNEMQDDGLPDTTHFKTDAGVEIINEDPEYVDDPLTAGQEAQRTYIKNYIQELEDLIMTPEEDFTEETHNRIAAMMDLQSAADYWFIQEFSNNGDAFKTSSTYLYKKRDDKLYWGPIWDFDLAWGVQGIDLPDSYYEGFNKTDMLWIDELRSKDPYFVDLLEERWPVFRDKLAELTEENGTIDTYGDELSKSQRADYEKWYDELGDNAEVVEDYPGALNTLKTYINRRSAWMDENLDELDQVYLTATFKAGEEILGKAHVRSGSTPDVLDAPQAPAIDDKVFVGWYASDGETVYHEYIMTEDTVFEAKYLDWDEAVHPEAVFFVRDDTWVPLQYGKAFLDSPAIYPEDVTSKELTYSVSDESIASPDGEGYLVLHKTGDVVVTARMYNGLEASYTVHIYDGNEGEAIDPNGIVPGPDMTLKPGEMAQVKYTLLPQGQPIKDTYVDRSIDDESVATIDYMGVVTALKPGTATITLSITPDYETGETYTATVKLTVTDPDEGGDDSGDGGSDDGSQKAAYTIKYDLNGGTLDGKTGVIEEQHKEGEVITVKDAPTRTGYTFAYWQGSKLYPGDKYTVTEDHTLKAVWTKNSGSSSGSSTTGTSARTGSSTSKNAASTRTGDNNEFMIWYLLMAVSLAAMLGAAFTGKRRKA